MPGKRGPKTKYSPELQKKICDVLSAGNYIEAACAFVGIHVDTYHEWVKQKSEFSEAVKRARAQAEMQSVARLRQAGETGQWQADAWFLERSYPSRWGRTRQDVNITLSPPKPIEEMTDDELNDYETKLNNRLTGASSG